jgi:hypothetical protein
MLFVQSLETSRHDLLASQVPDCLREVRAFHYRQAAYIASEHFGGSIVQRFVGMGHDDVACSRIQNAHLAFTVFFERSQDYRCG